MNTHVNGLGFAACANPDRLAGVVGPLVAAGKDERLM